MDVTFQTDVGRFNYHVAGVLIHENRLLVMTDERSPYYYLPGGRVSMNEESTMAIKREIKEELDVEVEATQLLWIVENFFVEQQSQEQFHEIGMYYLLQLTEEDILKRGQKFIMNEGGYKKLSFLWLPLEKIKHLNIYPLFLKERIMNLPQVPEHLVEIKE
ncbi:NUDIX domain-containing protein [Turicibacter sanguinis]|uniref:NUDIX hydrolase n=1 Tax=Turicibacter sanguinis TaxID=154288 RepID=UPI0012BCE7B6|nr:NUDIX domain-containing protein [Turicibacter sanguinis]MDB8554473.1 NUDIX domain-containing protein [Turicibacter sanguinis]MDB8557700.1 NUDIX domain-containing protein [Turicibacter sanguinis]MDB8560262.1 NUDIX domain-containing protein [Turicibacter sanguinis]MTN79859.1 NUDIX domain-containing protein [Turicibacter sanguinis]MTN83003.1 NUDIX domain-containing protein [Turicibacter sanguinis]